MIRKEEMIQLRQNLKFALLENPNYFGNLVAADLAVEVPEAAVKVVANTSFEELTCVSYQPQTEELRAVVRIKQTGGYSGGPCTDGSKEYVRFYVDYDRDGTWIDEGVVNFDAHDLPFPEELSYAVRLKLEPKVRRCCNDDPVLPRVRAILSWNLEPPAGQPDWLPPWGNRREADIQIEPIRSIWCWLKKHILDLGIAVDLDKLQPLAVEPLLAAPAFKPKALNLQALKEAYGSKVEDTRFAYPLLAKALKQPSMAELTEAKTLLAGMNVNLAEVLEFLKVTKFNTGYEEVKCVGLNRDLSVLHAAIHLKRSFGYSGGLCTTGSLEYVAFYMDFGTGWEYMGQSSVRVHDIPEIPAGGLWYNAALPVSLTEHQKKWCRTGKAKVRAILSWNVAPPPNAPHYVAPWGDWEEAWVEIRPLPDGVVPGKMVPVIESVGGMPIALINASGYANGVAPDGLTGRDSPFDGKVLVTGIIAGAPDSSQPGIARARYRLMVKGPLDSDFQPCLREFTIWVTEIVNAIVHPQAPVTQTPDPATGYVDYYPDFYAPHTLSVERNLLGVYVPAEAGLHQLRIEVEQPGAAPPLKSGVVSVMVDKGAPQVDVEITSGAGNCGVFTKGTPISGTFRIEDTHCYSVGLSVTPSDEAHGAAPIIVGTGGSSLTYGAGLTCPVTSGTWDLDTSPMDPCGYNIRIHGKDRTIVDSRWFGRDSWDIEGFCLMASGSGGGGGGDAGFAGCC